MPANYGPAFRKAAAKFLRRNPVCAVAGCGKRARHVDHVVPTRLAPDRVMDPTNWQGLCHTHHSALTRAYDGDHVKGACDEAGNPLDPSHPWAQADQAQAIRAANAGPKRPGIRQATRLKQDYVHGWRR